MILLIETATQVCSVALSHNGELLSEICCDEPNAHSSRLALLVSQLMKDQKVAFSDLKAVCVSSGPGSYTGLRIGVSSAKGYCYGRQIPLLAVPTLQSMAATVFSHLPNFDGLVCPMIDARRMECYTAFYRRGADGLPEEVRGVQADIIELGIYDNLLSKNPIIFVGDGSSKTQPILSTHPNTLYDNNISLADGSTYLFRTTAAGMARIAQNKLETGDTEDVAYFEPFYLKDFVAKKSIVRGLK